jgi:3D (Asp-Asp-Asp) domain-containing protein
LSEVCYLAAMRLYKIIPIVLALSSCQSVKEKASNIISKAGNKVDIRCTAYCAAEKDHRKYKKLTASGTQLKKFDAASDWSQFPVGTKLKINGNIYTITDYGSAMVHSKRSLPTVDIYQPSRREMNKWGVKEFNGVEIVKEGSYEESLRILKDRLGFVHCREMYQRILRKI